MPIAQRQQDSYFIRHTHTRHSCKHKYEVLQVVRNTALSYTHSSLQMSKEHNKKKKRAHFKMQPASKETC